MPSAAITATHPVSTGPRIAVALLFVVASVVLALDLAAAMRVALDEPWNDARLAPSAALLRGLPVWTRHGEGPLLGAVYGPVAVLTWTPAAAISTPAWAIGAGLVEALLLSLLPVIWIARIEAPRQPTVVAAVTLLGLAFLLSTPTLPGVGIHADVPAQAFGACALACAWTPARRRHTGWRWAGAAAAVAAAGSKQSLVPILVAYPLWIGIASGWALARRALLALVTVGTASLMIVIFTIDMDALLFASVMGPMRQPWQAASRAEALATAALDLLRRAGPATALAVVAVLLASRRMRTWRAIGQSERWLFPLVVAIACVPTSLIGRSKYGGAPNTLAPTLGFLWLAMLAAFAAASRRGGRRRRLAVIAVLAAACMLAIRLAPSTAELVRLLPEPPRPAAAFTAARSAPGTIYFPYRPLIGILADGRADHFAASVRFRELEDRVVDDAYLRAFLPPRLNRVATDRHFWDDPLPRLRDFRRQIHDAALPDWTVLVADDREPAVAPRPAPLLPADQVRELPAMRAGPPDHRVALDDIRLTIRRVVRRQRLRLDATTSAGDAHTRLEIEVALIDASGSIVMTLAVAATPDAGGRVSAEWPALDGLIDQAAHGRVLARGGDTTAGARWRLPTADARAALAGRR